MSRHDEMKTLLESIQFSLDPKRRRMLRILVGLGVVAFIVGLIAGYQQQVWQALLVNTMLFSGITLGGVIFSVIFTITSAKWGRPIKRLAEAMAGFIPVSVLLLILLFFGMDHFFVWVDPLQVIHAKAGWLNKPFFIVRNLCMMGLTVLIIWFYLKASLRPDVGLAKKMIALSNPFADRFVRNYGSQETEEAESSAKAKRLAPLLGLAFALLCTLLAFDWMMSIDQEWFSTMFGVQYFMSNLLGAAAALMIISGIVRDKFGLEDYITIERYHDLSKLAFAACGMWTYMVFSQVLVIWYSNMPEETPYIILRMQSLEWGWMFWLILTSLFILPFFGLLSRTACNSIWFSRWVAIEILVGLWLEKYFLILPSIQENNIDKGIIQAGQGLPGFSLNIFDIVITLGFLGGFILCYLWFLQRVPLVPISDQLFFKNAQDH
ncbi:MAG: molybdopterin oxidoreductase [SAR324 cluster bacterium]|nr:molybdopterin oxidoreductase [SAR324 cluster bacterium]